MRELLGDYLCHIPIEVSTVKESVFIYFRKVADIEYSIDKASILVSDFALIIKEKALLPFNIALFQYIFLSFFASTLMTF